MDRFNRIFDSIAAALGSLFFIALGAHGMYKYPQDVYRLYENQQAWYASEALRLLLLFTAMFCGGCVAARYYYQQFFGGKQTVPDETAAVMEGRKRRDKIATICLALFTICAGIIPLIYGWREYLLLAPRQVPRVAIAELLQKSPEGLIEVQGRFAYTKVWQGKITDTKESAEERVIYYYPLTDLNTKEHIYVATVMEPGTMKDRYGDREQGVRGLWHDFTPEEHKHTRMDINSYLDREREKMQTMQKLNILGRGEAQGKKWQAYREGMSMLPYMNAGMPFVGVLNIDDPGISPWIFPLAGMLFGIPLIALGISSLKPFLRK